MGVGSPRVLPAFAAYGIEIEYMIVDRETLDARPIADTLLRADDGRQAAALEHGTIGCSNELALHVIEFKNLSPTPELGSLPAAFQAELRYCNERLALAGAQLMPTAMHPWFDAQRETRLWPHQQAEIYATYDRLFDCRRHAQANIQSTQINLPFADDAEFARLHEAVRLVLPIIPALAASSPFADARWQRCLDYRMAIYDTQQSELPSSHGALIPEAVAGRADYEARVLAPIYREIAALDPAGVLAHEWLNLRAAVARFERSAIEIRVADVQECPQADLAIAAAVTAVVRRLYDGEPERAPAPTDGLRRILGACAVDGEQAVIDDADYLRRLGFAGTLCQAGELWRRLIDDAERGGADLAPWRPALDLILTRGPLARRILRAAGTTPERPGLAAIYAELCRCLNDGRLFAGTI